MHFVQLHTSKGKTNTKYAPCFFHCNLLDIITAFVWLQTKLVVRMCSVKITNYIILFYSQKETETDNQILLWLYLLNLFKLIRCTTYLGVILTNWGMISKCSNVSTKWQVAILKCLFRMKSFGRSVKMQLRIHFTFYHVPSLKIK